MASPEVEPVKRPHKTPGKITGSDSTVQMARERLSQAFKAAKEVSVTLLANLKRVQTSAQIDKFNPHDHILELLTYREVRIAERIIPLVRNLPLPSILDIQEGKVIHLEESLINLKDDLNAITTSMTLG